MRPHSDHGGNRPLKWALVVAFMLAVAYTAVFGLQGEGFQATREPPSAAETKEEEFWKKAKKSIHAQDESRGEDLSDVDPDKAKGKKGVPVIDGVQVEHGVKYLHPPFGYNWKRNVKRWEMIYNSMKSDRRDAEKPFSVVDYGYAERHTGCCAPHTATIHSADEGYFSISTAFSFPESKVIAIDMGGVGGSIWKKNHDVLRVQEEKARKYEVGDRFTICQTAAKPDHFFGLTKANTGHDYQFVLSVFHWFTMETRQDFEKVIVALFKNAKTTFIELPIAGDFGERFMKQVGSAYFTKWYDGRSDIYQIITDSLKAQGVGGSVSKIGSVKWLPGDKKKGEKDWDREVFRVDIHDDPLDFDCPAHFKLYDCKPSTTPKSVEFSKCMP